MLRGESPTFQLLGETLTAMRVFSGPEGPVSGNDSLERQTPGRGQTHRNTLGAGLGRPREKTPTLSWSTL
jgi:hypothetical protein